LNTEFAHNRTITRTDARSPRDSMPTCRFWSIEMGERESEER
jgi:hypothetical protein